MLTPFNVELRMKFGVMIPYITSCCASEESTLSLRGRESLKSAQWGLIVNVLEWVRAKILILMCQLVDTNVLAELEETEIEFWMYKYKRYDNPPTSWQNVRICV